MTSQLIVFGIFLVTYFLIINGKKHITTVAMFSAALVLLGRFLTSEEAIAHVDFDTLGLLIGMMILVGMGKRTGLFHFLAILAARFSGGNGWYLMVFLSLATAFASAFLDNVTTVLVMVPLTFLLADTLKLPVGVFLVAEIMAANVGGAATLIGDPPNMLLASAGDIPFMSFIYNLLPLTVMVFIIAMLFYRVKYGKRLTSDTSSESKVASFNASKAIKDVKLFRKTIIIFGLTLIGFIFHDKLKFSPAGVALIGAGLLMFLSGIHPKEALAEIEWPTIFFFIGLFILIGAMEKVGLMNKASGAILHISREPWVIVQLILWTSFVASLIIGAVPITISYIPIIESIARILALDPSSVMPLWWALSIGACLGATGSLLGSAANLVVSGLAESNGINMSIKEYAKQALPLTLVFIITSSVYLELRYFILR